MTKAALCVLLVTVASAQKKPITLDALDEPEAPRAERSLVWAPDGGHFAFREEGKLMVFDVAARKSKQVAVIRDLASAASRRSSGDGPFDWTNRRERVGGFEWFPDGKALLLSAGGDIFVVRADNGKWEQLTNTPEPEIDAKLSPDGKSVAFRRGWDLYAVDVQTKKEVRLTSGGSATLRNGATDWVYPEELSLGTAFWWSPDSKSIAYLQFDTSLEPAFPHEDLLRVRAVFEPEPYPQSGEPNATVHLGVVSAASGPTRWFDVGDTRDSYLVARAGWMPDSRGLYVIRTNRVQNRLEALSIELESGAASTLFRESDPYWINLRGDLEFLKDRKHFLWTSEEDGYRHIYLYSQDGQDSKQLTRGEWEVTSIDGVDESAGRVFYTSTEASRFERQLYVIGLDGKNKHRLTSESGTHEISMARGGSYYLDTFSSMTDPPRTVLHAGTGQQLAVYREPQQKQLEYDVLPAETVNFRGPDGTLLYGRFIKPAGFQQGKKYPVVVSVYGGPDALLPVRNAWPGINIDQVLAHHGYVIWQAENRGGSGRGHAFETAIFHKLGVNELADQVAGVQYLISLGFADPQRIGIHGWSYGGFMTVNALLNAPNIFRAGFAGAPVTGWLNYDTIYTERYMGLPKDNREGYEATALPAHAGNLTGKLMLAHNLEDDNVLFQNTLQLTNALQVAGRQFEMMIYPQKTHGVTGGALRQMNQMLVDFFDRSLAPQVLPSGSATQ
jgi:dipeptidyl-peptidase-4